MATRTNKKLSVIEKQDILLDTCIFHYLADKQLRKQVQAHLRVLKSKGNRLAVSEVTHFEIYRRRLDKTETSFFGRVLSAKGLVQLEIHKDFIKNATILCRHSFPIAIKQNRVFSNDSPTKDVMADMLLGGTVIDNAKALFMTANRKHFQEPFWKIVGECYLTRKKEEGWEGISVFLLKFDYLAFNKLLTPATAVPESSSTQPGSTTPDSPPVGPEQ